MSTRRHFFTATSLAVAGLPVACSRIWAQVAPSQPGEEELSPVDIATPLDGVERMDVFLLLGQSNMKGRGAIPEGQTPNPRVVMMQMRDDRWYFARDPLHASGQRDSVDGSDNAGTGPGLSFANAIAARHPSVLIGLVPCAVGGSAMRLWQKGVKNSLYDNALRRTRLATASAVNGKARVCAALWLQGESDATEDRYAKYEAGLLRIVDDLRADLSQPELPFIACTIPSFLSGHKKYTRTDEINGILLGLPARRPKTGCVDARDLKGHIGDRIHYDTASQTIIGRRYAEALMDLSKKS